MVGKGEEIDEGIGQKALRELVTENMDVSIAEI